MNLIPESFLKRFHHRPNLITTLHNLSWLFFDKMLRMGVGLVVSAWVARYLGPDNFGSLSYAIALIGLFSTISNLGLNSIVVRDLIEKPKIKNLTLGSAFFMQMLGGMLAVLCCIYAVMYIQPYNKLMQIMVILLGTTLIFKSTDVIKYWFESRLESRYVVWVENGVFILSSAIKVLMIWKGVALIGFIWLMFFESLIVAIGFLSLYSIKVREIHLWRVSLQKCKFLFKECWPLIISGLTISLYMRIDQLMLGQMLGASSVGLYSSALRISEVWYFVPMIIVSSAFPQIIKAREKSQELYKTQIQSLYNILTLLSIIIAVLFTFFSDLVIEILYGAAYAGSASILRIHVWTGIFVSLGVASGSWYQLEGLNKVIFYRTLGGALINVVANYFLIPICGGKGAALATLGSQIFAAYLFDASNIRTVEAFKMKTKALLLFNSFAK